MDICIYIYIYKLTMRGRPGGAEAALPPRTCRGRFSSRPVSELRFWISEGLTQEESEAQGVEFPGPWEISRKV